MNPFHELMVDKVFGKIKALVDEVVTVKEQRENLHQKLRELELRHEEAMIIVAMNDNALARQRESYSFKVRAVSLTQHILAYVAIIGFFAITGYILSHDVGNLDTDESFIIGNLTGMAAAIAKDIYGYYFGSSKGEQDALRRPRTKSV